MPRPLTKPFTYQVPDGRAFMHTLRLYLEARNRQDISALLAGASCDISPSTSYSGVRWGGFSTGVTFYVPGDQLRHFSGAVRRALLQAADAVIPKEAGLDVESVAVAPILQAPPKEDPMPLNAAALVPGAPVEHDGLRFRSRAETRVYDALKGRHVLFFPNAAAILGGKQGDEKREPDFLVCAGGKWGVLEVMGERYHPGATAARDHERARLFKDYGLHFIEFYDAARCGLEPEAVVDDFLRRLEGPRQ
jgi:hypothetical protein